MQAVGMQGAGRRGLTSDSSAPLLAPGSKESDSELPPSQAAALVCRLVRRSCWPGVG